jgi:hypothetical protein
MCQLAFLYVGYLMYVFFCYMWHVCFHVGVEVDMRLLNSTSCSFSATVDSYRGFQTNIHSKAITSRVPSTCVYLRTNVESNMHYSISVCLDLSERIMVGRLDFGKSYTLLFHKITVALNSAPIKLTIDMTSLLV